VLNNEQHSENAYQEITVRRDLFEHRISSIEERTQAQHGLEKPTERIQIDRPENEPLIIA
jgi:hypothetical protein